MKKFGRWENIAEVSNKIKTLLNTNQTINAFGYEIYLYKTNENYRINDAIRLLSNSNIISLLKSGELNKFLEQDKKIYVAELDAVLNFYEELAFIWNRIIGYFFNETYIDKIRKKAKRSSTFFQDLYKYFRNHAYHYSFIGNFYWDKNNDLLTKINVNFKELLNEKLNYNSQKILKLVNDLQNFKKDKSMYNKISNQEVASLIHNKGFEYFKGLFLCFNYILEFIQQEFESPNDDFVKTLPIRFEKKTKEIIKWTFNFFKDYFLQHLNNFLTINYNLFARYFVNNRIKVSQEYFENLDSLNLFKDFRLNLLYLNENKKVVKEQNKLLKFIYEEYFYTSTDKKSIKYIINLFFKLFNHLINLNF